MIVTESRGGTGGAPDIGGGIGGTFGIAGSPGGAGGGGGGGGAGAAGGEGSNPNASTNGGGGAGGAPGASGSLAAPAAHDGQQAPTASGNNGAGGGGGGGNGILDASGNASFTIGTVTGGKGGKGGDGTPVVTTEGTNAGGGGSGGYGFAETGSSDVVTLSGLLTGGMGGDGGTTSMFYQNPNGGDGGGGAYFGGPGSTLTVRPGTAVRGGTGGGGGLGGGDPPYDGAVGGAGGDGVVIVAGSSIDNFGTIQGGTGGMAGNKGSVGLGGAGISGADIVVKNEVGGTIAGGLSGDGTTRGDAITFSGGENNLLGLGAGTLIGTIGIGGNAGPVGLFNATGAASVSLTNVIHDYDGQGAVSLYSLNGVGTNVTLSGASTYTGGTTITSGSTLTLAGAPVYDDNDLVSASAGRLTITFAGSAAGAAELALDTVAQPAYQGTFSNTLGDFGPDDILDLKGVTGATALYLRPGFGGRGPNGSLEVIGTEAGNSVTEYFTLADPGATLYTTMPDGNGGTLVEPVVCFATGTRIRVRRDGILADIAVEDLVVGDLAATASGADRSIRWLGRRTIDCRRHPHPHQVLPVRIGAHALGPNHPARDLYVSPGHAICVDVLGEVLIPAASLIDGTRITQVEVERITYWHVELDSHDILLAEGLPAESYLDMGNRTFFAQGSLVAIATKPDVAPATHASFCRPFHAAGPLIEAARARLRTASWQASLAA